jgi:hypothetical protein
MFLKHKPRISTNVHKCHLSGRAFPKFCTLTPYLFVWLTTSPFPHSDFYSFVPTHALTHTLFFISFFLFLLLSSPSFPAQQLLLPIFFSFSSLPSPLFQHAIPSPFFLLFHFLPLFVSVTHTQPVANLPRRYSPKEK